MKVSVVGAGAIGSMFGGLLKLRCPDDEVLLLTRGEHGRVLKERGSIKLLGPWGQEQVAIDSSNDAADIAGSDFVLVTVKSQSTEDAIVQAKPHLGEATVVSIQNGINDPIYAEHLNSERVVMGMTETNMALLTPGEVSLQLDGLTVLGPLAGQSMGARVEQAAELLNKITGVGLRTLAHPNALGMRYNKLTINALGYTSCLSASNFIAEAIGNRAWRRKVGRPLVQECRRVFQAAGVALEVVPGRSNLSNIERLMSALDIPMLGSLVGAITKQSFKNRPVIFSLYQDLRHEKTTEVDFVNGEIVRLAAAAGVDAPINSEVVRMVHELEDRDGAQFFDRQEVIDRVTGKANG